MFGEVQTTQPHAETADTTHMYMAAELLSARKGLKMLDALERVLKGLKPVGRFSLPGFDRNQFVAILLPGNGRSRESAMPHGPSTLRINSPLLSPYVCRGNKRGSRVSLALWAQFVEHVGRADL